MSPTECFTTVTSDGNAVHITRNVGWIEKPIRKRNRWKWCFKCRKRLPHMLWMAYDPKPTYYEPIVFWRCGGCGKDRTRFYD